MNVNVHRMNGYLQLAAQKAVFGRKNKPKRLF